MKVKTKKMTTLALIFSFVFCFGAGLAVLQSDSVSAPAPVVAYANAEAEVPQPTDDFCMLNGASVRYSMGSTGLRFTAYLTEEAYTNLKTNNDSVSFGMFIMPYSYVEKYGDLTQTTTFGVDGDDVYYWKGKDAVAGGAQILHYTATELAFSEEGKRDAGYYYKCAITNLFEGNYTRDFIARAYYVTENDGVKAYTFTAENTTNQRSIEYVAKKAIDREESLTAAKLGILNSFAYLGDNNTDKSVDFVGEQTGSDIELTANGSNVDTESAYVVSGSEANTGLTISLSNMKAGGKYTFSLNAAATVGDLSAFNLLVSHYKDGEKYDGISEYVKTKTLTVDGNTYSAAFETAPIGFDEIRLQLVSSTAQEYAFTVDSVSIEECKNVEITNVPTKNHLIAGSSYTLDAKLNGLSGEVIAWASSNEGVATVTSAGVLSTLAAGKTEITATVTTKTETYVDYFELYVTDTAAVTSADDYYGLVYDVEAPTDFVLNIPTGDDIRILQLSDTQLMDMEQIREGVALSQSQINRWDGGEEGYETNCAVYIKKVFEKLEAAGTLPHIVVLAGDNTYGKFDDNGKMLDTLIETLESVCTQYGDIYWTFVFGNHDKESDIGIANILRKYSNAEHCLYAYRNVTGDSNFSVTLKQGGEYKKTLYMFDTNSTGANRVDEYALVYPSLYASQLNWYTETAGAMTAYAGGQVSSLAYMHIPFAEFGTALAERYGQDYKYSSASGADNSLNFTIAENAYGDFGSAYSKFSPWGSTSGTPIFAAFKENGTDGVFVGHNHTNNYSIVVDGVRLTFGLKTGTYDEYQRGLLGGTLTTLSGEGLNVEHVYAVEKNVENFDWAQDFTSNSIMTSSMVTEWGSEGFSGEIVENETGKALQLTLVDVDKNKYLGVQLPGIEANHTYKVTYTLTYSRPSIAHRASVYADSAVDECRILEASVLTVDGTQSFTFTHTDATSCTPLRIWFWLAENGDTITIDNVMIEDVTPEKIVWLDGDGTFEGEDGNVSLFTVADEAEVGTQFNWSCAVNFEKVTNDGNTAVKVTSSGSHSYDMLYIKIDTTVLANRTYTITYDAEWLDDNLNSGTFGYWVILGEDRTAYDVDYRSIAGSNLFKTGATITFTPTENSQQVYLLIREANEGMMDLHFNFTIDNIALTDITPAWRYADGSFEGGHGNVFFYTEADEAEVGTSYSWSSAVTLEKVTENGNSAIKVTSSGAHSYDFLYIKIVTPLKSGYKYRFSLDMAWLDDNAANCEFYYWVLTGEKAGTTIVSPKGITPADLVKTGATIDFTSTGDYDYVYLLIREGKSGIAFNFTIDNVKLLEYTVENTDGTFEGTEGNISIFGNRNNSEITNADAVYVTVQTTYLQRITDGINNKVLVTSDDGTGLWSHMFIKFNQAIVSGKSYTITFDAEWLGEVEATGYYYSLDVGTSQTQQQIISTKWTSISAANLFKEGASITFTANGDYDYFYLRIINNNGVKFNFTLDNITLTENA